MTTCSDLFYHLSFHFLFLSSFDTQEAVHHGSNDGHDGDLRQQPRSPSQRAYTVALRRETENGRPPPSNAAKVSCYRLNRQQETTRDAYNPQSQMILRNEHKIFSSRQFLQQTGGSKIN